MMTSIRAGVTAAAAAILLAASPLAGQESPNRPKFVKNIKAPGLEVRYLDFRWDEEAFDALLNGGAHPAAQRSWVLARLWLPFEPVKWAGKSIPVGPSLLVLNPARGQTGATLEIRYIDMREVFVDMNVIAEPPEGQTYQKLPAVFKKVQTTAPLLEVALHPKDKAYDLVVHYGNRQATVTLTR
jgi:hypothetical protein